MRDDTLHLYYLFRRTSALDLRVPKRVLSSFSYDDTTSNPSKAFSMVSG
jgi:hypothetical protein